jgi:hypothetical protein
LQLCYLLPFLLMWAKKVKLELNWYPCKDLLKTTSCIENKVGDKLQQFLKHFSLTSRSKITCLWMYFEMKQGMNCKKFWSIFTNIIIPIYMFVDVIWGNVKYVFCHDSKMLISKVPIKSIEFIQCSLVFNICLLCTLAHVI